LPNNQSKTSALVPQHALVKDNLTPVAASIIRRADHEGVETLLVTSCHDGEGKTVSSMVMAYALASEAERRVVLIDGNPAAPRLHEMFRVPLSPGFADLVCGGANVRDVLHQTEMPNLSMISFGSKAYSWLAWSRPAYLRERFAELKDQFDSIIFDGASIYGPVDSAVFAGAFDGVAIVIECEKTRWEVLQSANERLEKVGANILGVIMNKRKLYIPKGLYG
jgi:protein-tyrosine kinase